MSLTKVTYSMIDGAYVNVKDFGAVGDGVADDLIAIQAAIDSVSADNSNIFYTKGGTVFLPSGKYRVTGTIYLTKGVRLLGTMAGASFAFDVANANVDTATTIYADFASANTIVIDSVGYITATGLRPSSTTSISGSQIASNAINPVHSVSVEHLRIAAMGTTANVITGIRMAGSPGFNINNVEVLCGKYGIVAQASWGASIKNVNIQAGNVGLALTNDINDIQVDSVYTTVGDGPMTRPYFYYGLDIGDPVVNPTANPTQTTGLYTFYASGVINSIITEGSDIGLNFRNSSFTLNTPYAESLNDYWMFVYASRIVANSAVPGIGASLNLIYFAGVSRVDLSVSSEITSFFGDYVEFFDDNALCQVVIHESPKSTNNYKTLKYVWSQENGQMLFLASPNTSSNPNMLDDYEEGTFMPTIRPDGTGTAWTATSSGKYTKIGDTVFLTGKIAYTVKTGTGNYAWMANLPFQPSADTEWNFVTVLEDSTGFYQMYLDGATGFGKFYKNNEPGASGTLIGSELGDATGTISFAFSYKV